MSGGQVHQVVSLDMGEDGIAATHPLDIAFPHAVAPAQPDSPEVNTIREPLVVVGCISLPDTHFDFDSSFLSPRARAAFVKLARMRELLAERLDPEGALPPGPRHKPPLSIFGHADPTGQDDYNSRLSRRRAKSVYAVLVRDVQAWRELMAHGFGGDTWGNAQSAAMREALGAPPSLTGDALILAYMDWLCVARSAEGAHTPYVLDKGEDFLARGAGTHGKGDVQGCGEFNPVYLLSETARKSFESMPDKEAGLQKRNAAYEIDRRVIAFLFKPGSRVDPARWPCPHIHDHGGAVAACRKRFWIDGDGRRAPEALFDRRFGREALIEEKRPPDPDTPIGPGDDPLAMRTVTVHRTPTFACRFYHGIAGDSPCEGAARRWVVRMLKTPPIDAPNRAPRGIPLANRRFVVTMGESESAPVVRGTTSDDGVFQLPVFDEVATMAMKIDASTPLPEGVSHEHEPPPDTGADEARFMDCTLFAGGLLALDTSTDPAVDPDTDTAARQRLYNLGYGPETLEEWTDQALHDAVRRFQRHQRIEPADGELSLPARARLVELHDTLPPRQADPDTPAGVPAGAPGGADGA